MGKFIDHIMKKKESLDESTTTHDMRDTGIMWAEERELYRKKYYFSSDQEKSIELER